MAVEKGGALDETEGAILEQRVAVARAWLAEFAPDRYRVEVRADRLPPEAATLDVEQRGYLAALADGAADERPVGGDAWQDLLFRTAGARAVPSGWAFAAVYMAFLGRANGPRAGWLLASLDPDFALGRLREAGAAVAA
jgi:lysyl-tRNA synthetase class 1